MNFGKKSRLSGRQFSQYPGKRGKDPSRKINRGKMGGPERLSSRRAASHNSIGGDSDFGLGDGSWKPEPFPCHKGAWFLDGALGCFTLVAAGMVSRSVTGGRLDYRRLGKQLGGTQNSVTQKSCSFNSRWVSCRLSRRGWARGPGIIPTTILGLEIILAGITSSMITSNL